MKHRVFQLDVYKCRYLKLEALEMLQKFVISHSIFYALGMKKYLFILVFLSLSISAQTICERMDQGVQPYLLETASRISFKNRGGLFNGGVCWWHSRLQRASAYLAEFRPEAPAPSALELKKILRQLRSMNSLVVIPGFDNFYSFTVAYKNEVQSLLEAWQREDGFINQEWVRGISGRHSLKPQELRTRMDNIYRYFLNTPQPVWLMAQIKGISSHAFLLLDMIKIDKGFELHLIDSNHPLDTRVVVYQNGQTALKHSKEKYSFVPYTGFQKDYESILPAVKRICGSNLMLEDNLEILPGEIEVGR